jgi:hypothetical protein
MAASGRVPTVAHKTVCPLPVFMRTFPTNFPPAAPGRTWKFATLHDAMKSDSDWQVKSDLDYYN